MTSGKVADAELHLDSNTRIDELIRAFTNLRTPAATEAFLRDLCTEAELNAMGQRLQVARLVSDGVVYSEISRRTGASTATITRVAQWCRRGTGGYQAVLAKLARS
jgi:TrpR-related protein YerC/YecD